VSVGEGIPAVVGVGVRVGGRGGGGGRGGRGHGCWEERSRFCRMSVRGSSDIIILSHRFQIYNPEK
jgi:hypothetical protein